MTFNPHQLGKVKSDFTVSTMQTLGGGYTWKTSKRNPLASHIAACHNGEVSETCKACQEIITRYGKGTTE